MRGAKMKRELLLPVLIIAAIISAVLGLCGCTYGSASPMVSPSISQLAESDSPIQFNLSSQQEGIWLYGSGKVTVSPDIAEIRLGVESLEATVAEAQVNASEAMNEVKAMLLDNGISESDIQTSYFNIRQQTRWDDNKYEEVVIGYRVTNTVMAKVRNIDNVGAIIDSVVNAGGDLIRIDSVNFSIDDPSLYYEEARRKAMNDASAKADQLAELAGITLDKPTYISEGSISPVYRNVYYEADGAMATPIPATAMDTSISPGELEVILNIQVAYSIMH
jgi:uncharacterized protein YggE